MSKLSKSLPYHLFVEGKNDLHVVSSLCGLHHVNQNFNIKVCESVENAIGLFRLTLTNPSAYPRIGVVLDADTDVEKRWRQLVDILKSSNKYDCDGLDLPSDGLVLYPLNDYDAVVGIWIMPNNRFEGMLEDFALNMIPAEDLLAWQDEPGKPIGQAITARILNPDAEEAKAFIGWLNKLYDR